MILHENVNNPSKFRSDNYITRKVSFITLSKDRNILSFAKAQLSDANKKKKDKKH